MIARSILLGTTAIAALALAACNSSNDPGIAGAAESGELFPLGVDVPVTVNVMSADRQPGNTVTVSDELASVTLDELEFDANGNVVGFSVTLGLPDGTDVTITDDDNLIDAGEYAIGERGPALLAEVQNSAGDVVQVAVGLNTAPFLPDGQEGPEGLEDVLFVLARVDAADPDSNGMASREYIEKDDFNVYMLTGDETDPAALPEGTAFYTGDTIATAYQDGQLVSSDFVGEAFVTADFGESEVDIKLDGSYIGNVIGNGEQLYEYVLVGEDIAVEGSRYGGVLDVAGFNAEYFSEFTVSEWVPGTCDTDGCSPPAGDWEVFERVDLDGDVLGAFYGGAGQATAGVFGADETDQDATISGADVEIVGGYAAYADELEPLID